MVAQTSAVPIWGGGDLGGVGVIGELMGGADIGSARVEGAQVEGAHVGGAQTEGADVEGAQVGGAGVGRLAPRRVARVARVVWV